MNHISPARGIPPPESGKFGSSITGGPLEVTYRTVTREGTRLKSIPRAGAPRRGRGTGQPSCRLRSHGSSNPVPSVHRLVLHHTSALHDQLHCPLRLGEQPDVIEGIAVNGDEVGFIAFGDQAQLM